MMPMVIYCQLTVLEAIKISILSKLKNRVYIKKLSYTFTNLEQFLFAYYWNRLANN